jgi:hypothetical protein
MESFIDEQNVTNLNDDKVCKKRTRSRGLMGVGNEHTKTVQKVSEKTVESCSKNDKKACKNTEKDFKTLKRIRNMAQGRQPKNCAKLQLRNLLQRPSHS